jgi:hypothetical protein
MLAHVQNWDISEEKSASNHNIIKFNITFNKDVGLGTYDTGRLRIKEHQHAAFYEKLQRIASDISIRGQREEQRIPR